MPDNGTDKVFKKKIEEISEIPSSIKWNKDSSWNRLQGKRRRKITTKITYWVAAIIIIGLVLNNIYLSKIKPIIKYNNEQYTEMSEFQKRQKLREIEAKMSGEYINPVYCYTCEDMNIIFNTYNRPVTFKYFQTN